MPWYGVAVVVVLMLSTLANIAAVGKPREPITPGLASAITVANGLLVWAVLALGG